MAYLEQFTAEERALVVALPYRAGLWVGKADPTGNPAALEDEGKALEGVIAREASGMFHSAFVHEVMAELWSAKAQWGGWAGGLDSIMTECGLAARAINAHLARRDLDAYRATVLHIATEVAKAFRESPGSGPTVGDRISTHMRMWKSYLGSLMGGKTYDPLEIMNISPIENKALSALSRALSEGPEIVTGA